MRSHLKVKVFALSAEMTFIRKQEEKWKLRAKYARQKQNEQSAAYAEKNFWSQRSHRDDLKREARVAHLAYGYMRGVPYAKMENICYGPLKGFGGYEPWWSKIEAMVERFSKDETNPQDMMQKFAEWMAEAKIWYDGNKGRIKQLWADKEIERQRKLADTEYQKQLTEYQAAMRAKYIRK